MIGPLRTKGIYILLGNGHELGLYDRYKGRESALFSVSLAEHASKSG